MTKNDFIEFYTAFGFTKQEAKKLAKETHTKQLLKAFNDFLNPNKKQKGRYLKDINTYSGFLIGK